MECKFIKHGIALSYDQLLKPCCEWRISDQWRRQHHLNQVDIVNWHRHSDMIRAKQQLESDQWPDSCSHCERIEGQGRVDSIRGNGNNAYADYANDDITLEIRPGNTCNFACQTCWPAASSRVAQYYDRAGLVDIETVDSNRLDNFDFLIPVAHRIRDVVVLGGEPFYDKSCRKFLSWAQEHLTANLTLFTNGSMIDYEFLNNYQGKLKIVFSIDAVGRPAEYVRFGTVWNDVFNNYNFVRKMPHVETRVNITCSVFNYTYIQDVINLLCKDWPSVVSFGRPLSAHMTESVIPLSLRQEVIKSLKHAVDQVQFANIEDGQKYNAINALNYHINNLQNLPWNLTEFQNLKCFVSDLDRVKNISVDNYCNFLSQLLKHQVV